MNLHVEYPEPFAIRRDGRRVEVELSATINADEFEVSAYHGGKPVPLTAWERVKAVALVAAFVVAEDDAGRIDVPHCAEFVRVGEVA